MRIQVDVSDQKARQIKELMKAADFKNYAELFNNAVTLVRWTVKEVRSGALIVAFDERKNNMKELSMPFLQHVAEEQPGPAEEVEREDFVEAGDLLAKAKDRQDALAAEIADKDRQIAELLDRVTMRERPDAATPAAETPKTFVMGG